MEIFLALLGFLGIALAIVLSIIMFFAPLIIISQLTKIHKLLEEINNNGKTQAFQASTQNEPTETRTYYFHRESKNDETNEKEEE